jgi:hypothetical protein
MKLELLTNATVVDDAIRFVAQAQAEKQEQKQEQKQESTLKATESVNLSSEDASTTTKNQVY